MYPHRSIFPILLLAVSLSYIATIGVCEHIPETNTESSTTTNNSHYFSDIFRLYKECFANNVNKSYEECISTQVVILVDQVAHESKIPLMEGFALVKTNATEDQDAPLTQATLEASLPRNLDGRQSSLYSLLANKAMEIFRSHSLQIQLSEARRRKGGHKLKKMIFPFLVGVVLKATAFIPLVLAGMSVLALKSFAASKAALAITTLMGLRKFFSGGQHDGGHELHHKTHHVHAPPHLHEYMGHSLPVPVAALSDYGGGGGGGGQDAYGHSAAYGGHPHAHGHAEPYYGRSLSGDATTAAPAQNTSASDEAVLANSTAPL